LELFSLEEEAAQLPGGLFVLSAAARRGKLRPRAVARGGNCCGSSSYHLLRV